MHVASAMPHTAKIHRNLLATDKIHVTNHTHSKRGGDTLQTTSTNLLCLTRPEPADVRSGDEALSDSVPSKNADRREAGVGGGGLALIKCTPPPRNRLFCMLQHVHASSRQQRMVSEHPEGPVDCIEHDSCLKDP